MRTFSDSGSSLVWQIVTVVVALVLLVRRRWRLAAFVVVTIAGSSLFNSAVKATVNRDAVGRVGNSQPGVGAFWICSGAAGKSAFGCPERSRSMMAFHMGAETLAPKTTG